MNRDKNYWNLTGRPHTERKLVILDKYIRAWAKILFKQWEEHKSFKYFKKIYYVDCFAGRGKYHKGGKVDNIDGSPLIGLKCAVQLQQEFNNQVELNCIFIEKDPQNSTKLESFCKPFSKKVNCKIYKNSDVNKIISDIVKKIGTNAAFFFIDPYRLSELDCETIKTIVKKKGAKDIIVNYVCGAKRVVGAIKAMIEKGEITDKTYKLIQSIEKFHTLPVLKKCLNKTDREKLELWSKTIFDETDLKHRVIYEMMSSSKKEAVYYLLFASRKQVAKKIMKDIFEKEDMVEYDGQTRLFPRSFDIKSLIY